MNKFNLIALALTTLALTACGKSEAEKLVDAINVNPNPDISTPAPSQPSIVLWTGTGKVKMTGQPETACESVKVQIAEDATGFELKQFAYDCSGMSSEMDPIRLDLRGTELYMGASKVGQKQANTVEFEIQDSGATLGFRFVNDGTNLQTTHTMRASGFAQTLTAVLHK